MKSRYKKILEALLKQDLITVRELLEASKDGENTEKKSINSPVNGKNFDEEFFRLWLVNTPFNLNSTKAPWDADTFILECCQIIDTLFLFYKYGNKFLHEEFESYTKNKFLEVYELQLKYYTKNKILHKSYIKNELYYDRNLFRSLMIIIACKTAEVFPSTVKRKPYGSIAYENKCDHKFDYNKRFISLLKTLNFVDKEKEIALTIYERNIDILMYNRGKGLDNLKWFPKVFLRENVNVDLYLEKFDSFYRYISFEQGLELEKQNLLGTHRFHYGEKRPLKLIPKLIEGFTIEITSSLSFFPRDIVREIMDYLTPSFFEKISAGIERLAKISGHQKLYNFPTTQQASNSEACGVYSLYNACRFIAEDPLSPAWSEGKKFESKVRSNFDIFERWAKGILWSEENITVPKDLTPDKLEYVFEYILKEKDKYIERAFPLLNENLLSMQKSIHLSPYTIINADLNGDQKISFGGNIPHLKLQMGINILQFFELANKKEKVFHCLFIGVGQHWWVQFLVLSLSQSLRFIRLDSASQVYVPYREEVNLNLENILESPEKYLENVAAETMPEIKDQLIILSNNLTSKGVLKDHEETLAYKYCCLFIQFFSLHKNFVSQYSPVLDRASRLAFKCVESDLKRFEPLHKELHNLCSGFQYIGLFSRTSASTVTTTQSLSLS